ncbi:MAG TPA: hypothetical protein VGM36_03705, partial [Rhizomicrobium sp.]
GLIILTVIVAVVGGMGLKSLTLSSSASAAAVGFLVIGCILLFMGALIYTMARLTFLIPPVVVDENKVDLARGWILTRGSFWRIFCIGFAIFIPLILVQLALVVAIYGAGIFHQFADIMRAGLMKQITEDAMRHQMELWSTTVRARGLQVWPIMAGFALFFETFAYGLLYGASAFAYRAVNPPPVPGMLRDPV